MTSRVERRVLWHPRQEHRFIVGGGSQMSLFNWNTESQEFSLAASQADLQLMKCFAWCPDSAVDDLVAVGYSTGKVDLWHLEAKRHARDKLVSSSPNISLPVRSTRSAFALGFAYEKPNLLAVGLDKVRGDPSLVVWNIDEAGKGRSVAGSKSKPERAIVQQYAHAEVVSSVTFLPQTPNLLVAGVNLWLRLFDLRSQQPLHVAQAPASKTYGIVTDPFDSYRVACYGEGSVSVWDSRKFTSSLVTFTLKDAMGDGEKPFTTDTFVDAGFSPVRRGMLATLTRDANHVRFWDLQRTSQSSSGAQPIEDVKPKPETKESMRSSKLSRLSWAPSSTILPWGAAPENIETQLESTAEVSNVVLANTFKSKEVPRPIASFALAPSHLDHPLNTNIVLLSREGDIEMHELRDIPKHSVWSSRGDVALGAGTQYRVFSNYGTSDHVPEPWDLEARVEASQEKQENGSRRMPAPQMPSHPGLRDSTLTATRLQQSRGSSAAAIRRYSVEPSAVVESNTSSSPRAIDLGNSELAVPVAISGRQASHTESDKREPIEYNRSVSRGRKRVPENTTSMTIKTDISMIIRTRVLEGYALFNPQHNARLSSRHANGDSGLAEVWNWFNYSKHLLTFGSSRVHGIDFSYQGILGIWEGLEASTPYQMASLLDSLDLASPPEYSQNIDKELGISVDVNASLRPRPTAKHIQKMGDGFHGNFSAALNTVNSWINLDKASWKPTVHTEKTQQRKLALALCNWRIDADEIAKWEREGKYSQAACWLLFTNQGGRAIDILLNSRNETLQMLSGTVATLLQSGSMSGRRDLHDHCELLVCKLQDPHQRIMLSYVLCHDWNVILEQYALPLRERIAIALRFLDDGDLTVFLRKITDDCIKTGDIEGIMVTGLTSKGLDLLQSYVDATGDVQTAALLASYVYPGRIKDNRAGRWVEAYRTLLDGWKLFHHRCQFDIDRGKIVHEGISNGDFAPVEWARKQFLIRCHFCNKSINSQQYQRPQEPIAIQRRRAAACPGCGRALPRCSVCLMTIAVIPDSGRDNDLLHSSFRDTIDDAFVFCQTCRHGGHAAHIMEWFYTDDGSSRQRSCPVAGCECHCNEDL